ncbi:MAG: cytochrome c-type biogenesis protein CcmH [Myxococcota bacterium]
MIPLLFALGAPVALAAPAPPAPSADARELIEANKGAELIPGVQPGEPPPADRVDELARKLGKKLRCPVCQGSNIVDSPSATARAMFERTRQLIAAGYSEEQIIDYFVDKYDEFVLLDPQSTGLNIFLFIGPGLAFGLGLALALKALVGFRKEPGAAPLAKPPPEVTEELDDYERRLLAELNADD